MIFKIFLKLNSFIFLKRKIHKEGVVKPAPKSVKFKDLEEEKNSKNIICLTQKNSRIYNSNQIYEQSETNYFDNKNYEMMVQDEWMDSRSLIRFEETEYMNQVTTTTTVKNTNTNEELFKLFDNVIYDVYHLNQPTTPANVSSSSAA